MICFQHCYIFHASESLTPMRDFLSKIISWIKTCHVFLDCHGRKAMIFLPESAVSPPNYIFPLNVLSLLLDFYFNTCLLCKFVHVTHLLVSIFFFIFVYEPLKVFVILKRQLKTFFCFKTDISRVLQSVKLTAIFKVKDRTTTIKCRQ